LRERKNEQRGETERGRERERSSSKKTTPRRAGSPTRGSIPGPGDHDPSQRQMLNPPSHPGIPDILF